MSIKLKLEDLEVKSFVTAVDKKAVRGGGDSIEGGICDSNLTCNFKCGRTGYWECNNETDNLDCQWSVAYTCFCSGGPLCGPASVICQP